MQEGMPTRTERDSMGEIQVPSGALYGAQTMRAVRNFPISGLRFNRAFIRALGQVKLAAAAVNADLGLLQPDLAEAIQQAAREVVDGKLDEHFPIDIFQTGSGTSTNMNANEVIANKAIQILGGEVGSKKPVHPNDHVNLGQSSNDVIPTVIHLSVLSVLHGELEPALGELHDALSEKAREFMPVIKTGRTHLQDATPIRLGQEFEGYAGQIDRSRRILGYATQELSEVALGGTAVGTGINTDPEFARRVCERLSDMNGFEVRETDNHFQAQSTLDTVVFASGVLRTIAVSLTKIASDVRLMGTGPRAGLGEITLPEVQPGSSIMPGKVNPVIVESLLMVCAQVIGNDTTVMLAGQGGNFELNTMMPVAAHNLLESAALLASASRNFSDQCVKGVQATERGPQMVEQGLAICTALAPEIGYDAAAAISKEAHRSGRTVREVARELTTLSEADLDRILDPASMTEPGNVVGLAGG
ncbi:MAG: class II fumarate hydratase [Chloroflexota bacterium]|nr:class II fumarate hydratase [Chloroflexota bacterium]